MKHKTETKREKVSAETIIYFFYLKVHYYCLSSIIGNRSNRAQSGQATRHQQPALPCCVRVRAEEKNIHTVLSKVNNLISFVL